VKTTICSACGCSLVRLGISKDAAVVVEHDGQNRYFCCEGCADIFVADPENALWETCHLIVCPTCLAEKTREVATAIEYEGGQLYFCRCPHCVDLFHEAPEFYISRLEGRIPNEGVMGHGGCCIVPG
jgi:YHS domain-containing protein